MDTIVKDFGFFVEACHVPSVQNVIRLLGMEPAHLADGVIGSPPYYSHRLKLIFIVFKF